MLQFSRYILCSYQKVRNALSLRARKSKEEMICGKSAQKDKSRLSRKPKVLCTRRRTSSKYVIKTKGYSVFIFILWYSLWHNLWHKIGADLRSIYLTKLGIFSTKFWIFYGYSRNLTRKIAWFCYSGSYK
ncbi:MAG: hypothetical protein COB36_13530 [Alphaproteobacteria bacterium]|nr:MAG: hypothetical protein COB36_13530 [Alphaproteobacteria bacterium]